MKQLITVIIICLLCCTACYKEETCTTSLQRIDARILSVEGPDSMRVGETTPLSVMVDANVNYCVIQAEATSNLSYGSSVLLSASLLHAGSNKSNGCNCVTDKKVYTLFYFTPLTAGTYSIGVQSAGAGPDPTFTPHKIVVY